MFGVSSISGNFDWFNINYVDVQTLISLMLIYSYLRPAFLLALFSTNVASSAWFVNAIFSTSKYS